MRAVDLDPSGEHHGGMPTYPWRYAPAGLATRRQLRQLGLRPAQDVVAQMFCRNGQRVAYLYRVAAAKPVRPMTPARRAALAKADLARRTCKVCRTTYEYCLPRSLGCCLPCSELDHQEREQLAGLEVLAA